jgi:hypothetical protein
MRNHLSRDFFMLNVEWRMADFEYLHKTSVIWHPATTFELFPSNCHIPAKGHLRLIYSPLQNESNGCIIAVDRDCQGSEPLRRIIL